MGALQELFETELAKCKKASEGRPLSDREFDKRCVSAISRAAAEVHCAGSVGGPDIDRIRDAVKSLDFIQKRSDSPAEQQQALKDLEAAIDHPDLLTQKLMQPKPSQWNDRSAHNVVLRSGGRSFAMGTRPPAPAAPKGRQAVEMVTTPAGIRMPKADYEDMQRRVGTKT